MVTDKSKQETLAAAEQELSRAGTFSGLLEIVGHFARALNRADGATVVLNDGPNCFYVEEDAIGPLWKGRRFPQTTCVSGWAMMNRQPAVIEDIFHDPRVPIDAYKPTFVRSLLMVPVGGRMPVAAIGNYWARPHRASEEEIALLEALAVATAQGIARLR